ncbi:hypothetical protein HPB51_019306 [Rhipicephalus microplus]|uniref:THAP-type domain-containing protein n=1 Tax=Rhipicephalus microplus TaxID=6941 RepID=A0A9J6EUI5_RHIMP|nr:hypothetical protein HPB51_019306 [Rhipicephalus microplus]
MGGFSCCVPGCYNNSTRDKDLGFYVFPKEQKLRETWIQRINRLDGAAEDPVLSQKSVHVIRKKRSRAKTTAVLFSFGVPFRDTRNKSDSEVQAGTHRRGGLVVVSRNSERGDDLTGNVVVSGVACVALDDARKTPPRRGSHSSQNASTLTQ